MYLASQTLFRFLGCKVGLGTRVAPRSIPGLRKPGVRVGSESMLACRISLDRPSACVEIGDRCYIGASHLVAATRITIEDDVMVSWGVTIVDHNSHALEWEHRQDDVVEWAKGRKDWTHVDSRPVVLKSKCWIGFHAAILKGVTIGEGAIVGACSVVTQDVPPYTVVAGNPARVVKTLRKSND